MVNCYNLYKTNKTILTMEGFVRRYAFEEAKALGTLVGIQRKDNEHFVAVVGQRGRTGLIIPVEEPVF